LNPNAKRLLETAIPETVGFYSTFGRIWEFMIGAFLSLLPIQLNFKNIKMTTRFEIFVVIILTVLFLEPIKISFVARVISLFMLAVIYILFKIDLKHDYFPLRQLKAIGDRSYSWYLVHMPIAYLVNSSPILQNSSKLNSILKIFGLIFLVLLGNVLFNRVESKFRTRSSENLITEQNFKFKFVIFFIIPLLLTITAKIAFNIVYEIQIVSKKPSYAGDLIHDLCNPQSLITDYPCEFKIKTNANPDEANSNSIVLVGDSHALQYTVAFNSIVNKLNLKAYYYGDLYENNNFEEFVAANNIDIIVISKFWNLGTYHDLLKGLSKIKNVEIIVVGQNPVFPDGKKFMVFNSFFQNKYEAPLDAKISELESEPLRAGQAVKYLSIRLGYEYIDIQSIFCSNGICTRFDNNNWFWIDRDHLSIAGANKVKPTFESVLRSYMG
jgi:hypothetical protein